MADELTASLILKLQDQLSGGLRSLQDQLEELTDVADKLKLSGLDNALDQTEALNAELTRTPGILERIGEVAKTVGRGFQAMGGMAQSAIKEMTGRVRAFQEASANFINRGLGAAAEGFVVYEPMRKYAEYENIVRHIGITEGLSGDDLDKRTAYLKEFFWDDAIKTGQSSESVALAYKELTQMGMRQNLDTIIQAHSRAATAYGTTAEALGPAVAALAQTLKVPAGELGTAMAAMAQATKEGRFKIEDFSRELPGVAAQMSTFGMSGRKAANIAFAALETVMKNSSNPSQASTDINDLLRYLRSGFAARHFAKSGISLHNVLEAGLKQGDVIGAVIAAVTDKVKGKDLVGFSEVFGQLFHNQQAGDALLALLQHREDYEHLKTKLGGVDAAQAERDFINAVKAPAVQMQIMDEKATQVEERFGEGFLPILKYLNISLLTLNDFLHLATERFPKLTAAVLAGLAGLLALGTILGLIGAVAPLVSAGFGLVTGAIGLLTGALGILFSPIMLVIGAIAAIVAAAEDIYDHWGSFRSFFVTMWDGVKEAFHGFISFLTGVFTGDFGLAWDGIKAMADGIAKFFGGLWDAVKQVFMDFVHWVDGWAAGLGTHILNGIRSGWDGLMSGLHGLFGGLGSDINNSATNQLKLLAQQRAQQSGGANDNTPLPAHGFGHVLLKIQAEPGTSVTGVQSTGPVSVQAPVTAPSRGATVGRP